VGGRYLLTTAAGATLSAVLLLFLIRTPAEIVCVLRGICSIGCAFAAIMKPLPLRVLLLLLLLMSVKLLLSATASSSNKYARDLDICMIILLCPACGWTGLLRR
jgi:hypothetical protein